MPVISRVGWMLMGYPIDLPGWRYVYRLGTRLHNARIP